jgi:hypothetical protein
MVPMSELLTVAQVAFVLKCSEDTVVRRFEKRSGVIDLGTANNGHRNRRYRVLRIPKTVVEKYLVERNGSAVKIEVPPEPAKRRKSPNWKNIAILNLAKIGKQNECEDKKVYKRIAELARLLAAKVPEDDWADICTGDWLDEEEQEYE